jgi:RNA recognition motif-containing protein
MASSSVDNIDSPLSVVNPSNEDEKSSINNLDEQYRKLFIGGLSYTTTDDKLK